MNGAFQNSGKWGKINDCLGLAVAHEHKLSGYAIAILIEMVSSYNRSADTFQDKPKFLWSYEDIAKKLGISRNGAIKTMQSLKKTGLVTSLNSDERKGRSKTQYLLAVSKINKIVNEYIKINTEYKS